MSALRFTEADLTFELWREAYPLLEAHWHEIGHYQDIPLEPDVELYMQMASLGIVKTFTARRNGTLVGYALFFVKPNPHYRSSTQAVQDVVYLAPAVRGVSGLRFLRYCESMLRLAGVEVIYHHVKAAHNTFGRALEHDGYQLVDLIYAKRVN